MPAFILFFINNLHITKMIKSEKKIIEIKTILLYVVVDIYSKKTKRNSLRIKMKGTINTYHGKSINIE